MDPVRRLRRRASSRVASTSWPRGPFRRATAPTCTTCEWPVNLARHFEHHFAGPVQHLELARERLAELDIPVLTIHGTRDRNAPYGAGREWAYLLPDARLLSVDGATHESFGERPDLVRRR